jgi:hypothetical protein
MSNQTFQIPRLTDHQVAFGIRTACQRAGCQKFDISAQLLLTHEGMSWATGAESPPQPMASILELGGRLFESFSSSLTEPLQGLRIQVQRKPEEPCDRLIITAPDQSGQKSDSVLLAKLLNALQTELRVFGLSEEVGRVLAPELQRFYQERDAAVTRVETLAARMIEDVGRQLADGRKQQADELAAREKALLDDFGERRTRLDSEIQAKRDELQRSEDQFKQRLQEIDDRDSRHVRREIRKDLKRAIADRQQSFQLTRGTRNLRWPVHTICLLLLLFFGCELGYLIAHPLPSGQGTDWFFIIRQVFVALAFGSTAIFYVRWLNQWFREHAREEFKVKRFELDLDRASWVVEMAMEWQDQKGTELPPHLIEKLTQTLFTDPDVVPEAVHPTEQLASALLGASAEANLQLPGGVSLKLDRKSLKQLNKENGS